MIQLQTLTVLFLGPMDTVSRRLLKELRGFDKDADAHPEILELAPESDHDLTVWKARLAGLSGTPYEG